MDFRQQLRASETIIVSAAHGRLEELRKGIADGGDVNFQRSESTPVMVSIRNNHPACLKLLLENQADASLGTSTRWAPLHEASFHDRVELIELLLAQPSVNVGVMDRHRDTPLMVAINRQSHGAFGRLLQDTPEGLIDHQNIHGETALFLATKAESQDMVAHLVARGADPTLANYDGQTPADYAAASGWTAGQALLAQARRAWAPHGSAPAPVDSPVADATVDPAEPAPVLSRIGKRRFGG